MAARTSIVSPGRGNPRLPIPRLGLSPNTHADSQAAAVLLGKSWLLAWRVLSPDWTGTRTFYRSNTYSSRPEKVGLNNLPYGRTAKRKGLIVQVTAKSPGSRNQDASLFVSVATNRTGSLRQFVSKATRLKPPSGLLATR